MKKLLLFFFPCFLFGFELQPWYPTVGEFNLRSAYSFCYYPSVSQGRPYHSHDHRLDLNLGVQFWSNWDVELESGFLHSRRLNWGTERVGLQLRHLFLDDVAGDPISLSIGLQGFYVPTRSLRDAHPCFSLGYLTVFPCPYGYGLPESPRHYNQTPGIATVERPAASSRQKIQFPQRSRRDNRAGASEYRHARVKTPAPIWGRRYSDHRVTGWVITPSSRDADPRSRRARDRRAPRCPERGSAAR